MTFSDLAKYSMTKHRAVCLQQLSILGAVIVSAHVNSSKRVTKYT